MRLNPCSYSSALRAIFDPNFSPNITAVFIKNKIKILLVHLCGCVCGEFGRKRSRQRSFCRYSGTHFVNNTFWSSGDPKMCISLKSKI